MDFRPLDNLANILATKRLQEGLRLGDAGMICDASDIFVPLPIQSLKSHVRAKDIAKYCYRASKQHQSQQRIPEAIAALKRAQELGFDDALIPDRLRLLAQWPRVRKQVSFDLEENRRLLKAGGLWPDGCNNLYDCLLSKEVLILPTLGIPRDVSISDWTALGRYQPWLQRPWTQLIRAYKEAPSTEVARAFAVAAYEHLLKQSWFCEVDLIVPIPPNPTKFARRGFGPTDMIAKELERMCAIPSRQVLDRSVPRRDTQEADYAEVLSTYNAERKWETIVKGSNVLLMEDIITKGKNINAGGTRLFQLGAAGVYVVALARTQDS